MQLARRTAPSLCDDSIQAEIIPRIKDVDGFLVLFIGGPSNLAVGLTHGEVLSCLELFR
jgi:hypothetical protein